MQPVAADGYHSVAKRKSRLLKEEGEEKVGWEGLVKNETPGKRESGRVE